MKVSFLQRIFIGFTFILALFPFLPFGVRSVVTILWCLLGIVFYFKENKIHTKLNKDILVFVIPYFVLIFSLFYSKNIDVGLNILTKMLSFIIIPIPFYLNKNIFNNKILSRILYVFSATVVFFVLYQMLIVFFNKEHLLQGLTASEIKINGYTSIKQISEEAISRIKLRRFRNFISSIFNTHPTYQGLWISFVIFIFISTVFKRKKKIEKIIFSCLILLLLAWLYLISTRMPLIALFVSGIITTLLFGGLTKKKSVYFGLSIAILCTVSLSLKNPFSFRVKEYLNTRIQVLDKSSKIKDYNSSNVRNGIYYCSINVICNNFLIGVGVGDMQDELNACYSKELLSDIYTWTDYNTHNQYLFFFVAAGFVGFVVFLLFLFYMIIKSYRDKNFIYFYFLISVSFMFLTENFLVRSDGILFFTFFNSLFFYSTLKERNYL